MVDSWWDAHELEFVIGGIALGICFVGLMAIRVSDGIKARRKFKREADDQLKKEP